MKLLLLALYVAHVSIVHCRSLPSDEHHLSLLESVKSYLTEKDFISSQNTVHETSKRHVISNCTEQFQCFPSGISHVPTYLINCIDSLCVCNGCFKLSSDGDCTEVSCEDQWYNQAELKCEDHRPKQKTAFFLSFFLFPLGAANFYIGRDDLGGAQLFLLIALLIAISLTAVMGSFLCCGRMDCCCLKIDNKKARYLRWSTVVSAGILAVVIIIEVLWWLSDLIIFASNQRNAGNGCSLQGNL